MAEELCLRCLGRTGECPFPPEECPDFQGVPFPNMSQEDWRLPLCACGRPWSQCDGTRIQCHKRTPEDAEKELEDVGAWLERFSR